MTARTASRSSSRVLLITDSESVLPVRRAGDNTVAFAEGRGDGLINIRLINLGPEPIVEMGHQVDVGAIVTLVGTGEYGYGGDGGPAQDAVLFRPWRVVGCEGSVLFTGVSGVGKTAAMMDTLSRIEKPKMTVSVPITFSAQTTSQQTQLTIESKLEKRRKTIFGAPPGKNMVLFVLQIFLVTIITQNYNIEVEF